MSFGQGWIGEASCGCFGRVKVNPWVAFIVDVCFLTGLLFARPASLSRDQLKSEFAGAAKPLLLGGSAVAAVLCGIALLSWSLFGSIEAGLAHLRGEALSAYPRLVELGVSDPGQVHSEQITLQNWTNDTIRVVGGTDNCSCVTTHDMPIDIPSGEAREIKISMRAPYEAGAFNVWAVLVMNDGRYGRVPIRLTGVVRKSD